MSPPVLLLLASLGLLIGPLCQSVGARWAGLRTAVDGFALALVGGLCVVYVLPHVVGHLGLWGLALTLVGLGVPALLHRTGGGHGWSVALVALALSAHVVLDGAILATAEDHTPLAWAVIAHRLPVGFAIVIAAQVSSRATAVSWGLAAAMVVGTVVGYGFGAEVLGALSAQAPAVLEAVMAGVLLHVVFMSHGSEAECAHGHGHGHGHPADSHDRHDHHEHSHGHGGEPHAHHDHAHHDHAHHDHAHTDHAHHDHAHHDHAHHDHAHHAGGTSSAAAGALAGLLVLVLGARLTGSYSHGQHVDVFLSTLWLLVVESAPALLLGYALAGLVPILLSPGRISSLARGGRVAQSVRGVAFGLPLPVCSCGVLPLYESLIRRGAPPAAAMAFFVATPELGLDAVLLSVPLLGGSLTIARVIAAVVVALLVALLVRAPSATAPKIDETFARPSQAEPWPVRLRAGLRFGFEEVLDHTMPWIALGLVIAAMAEPMLAHGAAEGIPSIIQVPMAAAVGVPIYVCASGATPVAALAVHKGFTAGAAIAFLIAGPATNVTTFGVLARLHGRRTALAFGLAVTVLAILVGWTVDALAVPAAPLLDARAAEDHTSWFGWVCAIALGLLTAASLFRQGPRGALLQIREPFHTH